jgi:hypothetical protein
MIDYGHPVFLRMKEAYRLGRDASDEHYFYAHFELRDRDRDLAINADALQVLSDAMEIVSGCAKTIREAKDIPDAEKMSYDGVINMHLENLTKWKAEIDEFAAKDKA